MDPFGDRELFRYFLHKRSLPRRGPLLTSAEVIVQSATQPLETGAIRVPGVESPMVAQARCRDYPALDDRLLVRVPHARADTTLTNLARSTTT